MKKHIALLFGGRGREHDVSVAGHATLRRYLNCEKYRVTDVFIDKNGDFYIEDADKEKYPTFPVRLMGRGGFLSGASLITPDAVFPLLHGDFGEDGKIQGLLECTGLPFVGEGTSVGALTSDKAYTKAMAERLGIPVAPYVTFRKSTPAEEAERISSSALDYPMFIKPTGLGSSVGAKKADSREHFISAYNAASELGDVIVEALIENKRELECAFLYYRGESVVTPPSEILCEGTYGYREKYKLGTKTETVARVDGETSALAREYSRRLAKEIGIFSLSRIDFFLSGDKLIFNEINTLPGLTDDSMYLKMLRAYGFSECDVIDALIERAAERV
ncbi:MAG: ATP-grasp domain-containing protein [Clostridia bacterium]|nr:ATP-grasp domain-containing protein [Clostridia bacterium]